MLIPLTLFDYYLGIRAKGLYLPIEMIRLLPPFLLLRSVEPPFVFNKEKYSMKKKKCVNMIYEMSNAG